MTELERSFKKELELQRELFRQELRNVTRQYKAHLNKVAGEYHQIVTDQRAIIEQQSKTLSQYGQLSKEVRVSLDSEPVRQLQNSHKSLLERLDALEQSDKHLLEQLNAVLKKL